MGVFRLLCFACRFSSREEGSRQQVFGSNLVLDRKKSPWFRRETVVVLTEKPQTGGVVRDRGFEPLTPSVSRKCSTTELTAQAHSYAIGQLCIRRRYVK